MSSRNKTWCKRMRSAVLKVLRTISGYWSGLLQDLPPFIYKQKANVVVTVIQVAWKSGRHDWEANMWDSLGHDAWSVKQTWTPACWMQLRTQDSWTRNGMVLNKIQHPLCFLFFHIPLSTRYEIIAVTRVVWKVSFSRPQSSSTVHPLTHRLPGCRHSIVRLTDAKMSLLGDWKISPRFCSRSHCRREWDFWDEVIENK